MRTGSAKSLSTSDKTNTELENRQCKCVWDDNLSEKGSCFLTLSGRMKHPARGRLALRALPRPMSVSSLSRGDGLRLCR